MTKPTSKCGCKGMRAYLSAKHYFGCNAVLAYNLYNADRSCTRPGLIRCQEYMVLGIIIGSEQVTCKLKHNRSQTRVIIQSQDTK